MPPWLQTALAVTTATLGIAAFLRTILESLRKELRGEISELRGEIKDIRSEVKETRTAVHGLEVRFAERFGSSPRAPEAPAE